MNIVADDWSTSKSYHFCRERFVGRYLSLRKCKMDCSTKHMTLLFACLESRVGLAQIGGTGDSKLDSHSEIHQTF